MITESHKEIHSLASFNLSFEYDKTWHEARKAVKARVAEH